MNVSNADSAQLCSITSSSRVHWKENRPSENAACEAKDNNETQEPEEEIGINGGMPKKKLVIEHPKVVKPPESSLARRWRSVSSFI